MFLFFEYLGLKYIYRIYFKALKSTKDEWYKTMTRNYLEIKYNHHLEIHEDIDWMIKYEMMHICELYDNINYFMGFDKERIIILYNNPKLLNYVYCDITEMVDRLRKAKQII